MIHLCLLAAGGGTRFGSNKLLASLNGRPVWTYGYDVLRTVREETGARLHVVTRYPEILTSAGENGVPCPESELGLSYTVRAACASCGQINGNDRILFLAADQPLVTADTVRKLMNVHLAGRIEDPLPLAACASPDGVSGGNPVVFSGALYEKLMCLTGDQGGKAALRAYPGRTEYVLCPGNELHDIDIPGDLEQIGRTT